MTAAVSVLFQKDEVIGPYRRSQLWSHLVSVGLCSRLIAMRIREPEFEDMFLAGLLHDIGIVLEDQFAHPEFCGIIRSLQPEASLIECEQRQLSFDHTLLGDRMAERWRFPQPVRAAIRYHHMSNYYEQDENLLVRCVEAANVICSHLGITSVGLNLVRNVDFAELELPMAQEELPALSEELKEEITRSASLFDL